jgi:hypothetical protein
MYLQGGKNSARSKRFSDGYDKSSAHNGGSEAAPYAILANAAADVTDMFIRTDILRKLRNNQKRYCILIRYGV